MKMVSIPNNIAVNLQSCLDNDCLENCEKPQCELCINCLNSTELQDFHEIYRENSRRGGFMRIFPSEKFNHEDFFDGLTPASKKSVKWFEAKCQIDEDFC